MAPLICSGIVMKKNISYNAGYKSWFESIREIIANWSHNHYNQLFGLQN